MRRREFIQFLSGAAAIWPFATGAQQPSTSMRRIGVILRVAKDDPDAQRDLQAFRDALHSLGWTIGRTIQIE
jgi:hypothetical protein